MPSSTSISAGKPAAPGVSDPLQSMRRFARVLDDLVRLPGTKIGIGLDPLLNLIPFAGDAVGTVMSLSLLVTAVKMGVPKRVLARMVVNIGIDALVGAIPVIGQIFDFVWKANTQNMALLERYAVTPDATKKASGAVLGIVVVSAISIVAGAAFCTYWLLSLLASALNIPLW